ncbi:tyrosine-type recombinase/integrase [Ligilactobacillus hayakitensis]|uniref:tyrosine-type recombinase/integrase n=1 Tax=Ligilactobacillus hayakitensis TaxID=396716 RepID=UPI001CDAC949|nr:tyrosine-type recombinase/integrase [Ligilactobacillus hayakitensis]
MLNVLNELKTTNNRKLVFKTKQGTLAHPNSVNATLKKALNNLHINRPGFHTHSLRHTHVALLLSQGGDIFAISKRLGHSDVGTTTKYYAYLVHEYAEMENRKTINAFKGLDLSSDVDNYQHTKKPVKRATHQINID